MPDWLSNVISAFVGGVAGGWVIHRIDTERWRSFLWRLHRSESGTTVWWGGQMWFEQPCPHCGEIGDHACPHDDRPPSPDIITDGIHIRDPEEG